MVGSVRTQRKTQSRIKKKKVSITEHNEALDFIDGYKYPMKQEMLRSEALSLGNNEKSFNYQNILHIFT